jgi:hypothetical protein
MRSKRQARGGLVNKSIKANNYQQGKPIYVNALFINTHGVYRVFLWFS